MSKPIYLLHGQEGVLITEKLQNIKTEHNISSLSTEVLSDGTTDITILEEKLQSTPMLFAQGPKLVVIPDSPFFVSSKADELVPATDSSDNKTKTKSNISDKLISILNNIGEDNIVVFTFQESTNWKNPRKVDKRKKIYKTIKKIGHTIEFNSFAEWETQKLHDWIQHRIEVSGKKIAQDALTTLSDCVGTSLSLLASELSKLITYIGNNSTIEKKDVLTLASEGQVAGFTFVNALRDRDGELALNALKKMLHNGENEVGLIMRIVSQFRTLLQIKLLSEQGKQLSEITRIVGGHPYALKLLFSATKKFSLVELENIMLILADADYSLKTGRMNKEVILELIVINICDCASTSSLDK